MVVIIAVHSMFLNDVCPVPDTDQPKKRQNQLRADYTLVAGITNLMILSFWWFAALI